MNERRVLVVDDDSAIRDLLAALIRRQQIDVDCAGDGAQAIALIQQHQYSVIMLDLMMPRVDGFGVIEYLRTHEHHDSKPLVFIITAYADQRFKEVDSSIVSGIIHKPFDVGEIGNLIRHCLDDDARAARSLETASDRAIRDFAKDRGDDEGGRREH